MKKIILAALAAMTLTAAAADARGFTARSFSSRSYSAPKVRVYTAPAARPYKPLSASPKPTSHSSGVSWTWPFLAYWAGTQTAPAAPVDDCDWGDWITGDDDCTEAGRK